MGSTSTVTVAISGIPAAMAWSLELTPGQAGRLRRELQELVQRFQAEIPFRD